MREGELAGVLGQDPEPGAGLALGCAANDAHRCAHDTAAHYYARAGEVREHIEADGLTLSLITRYFMSLVPVSPSIRFRETHSS